MGEISMDAVEQSLRDMYELGKKHGEQGQIDLINRETMSLNSKLDAIMKDLEDIKKNMGVTWEK
jgi:hypothetical protein